MIVRPVTQPLVDKSRNVVWHEHQVTRTQRANQKAQRPCVIWLTGLSGSGKSTLANALEQRLLQRGYHSYLLDGDNVRHGLNRIWVSPRPSGSKISAASARWRRCSSMPA